MPLVLCHSADVFSGAFFALEFLEISSLDDRKKFPNVGRFVVDAWLDDEADENDDTDAVSLGDVDEASEDTEAERSLDLV